MTSRRALLIVNRNCRQGNSDLSAIIAALAEQGIEVEAEYPESIEHSASLIRGRGAELDLIILGGGDGTLRSAIEPVLKSGRPLGVLPLGTANDLARSLGVPQDPVAAARAIAGGIEHRIDLGRVNGHYFFNASNIGLGVGVTRALSYALKQRWGPLSYARALWVAARQARTFSARIVCDGQEHHVRSMQITVGNGRFYGGGMTVHAEAALDDQQLDVYSLQPQSLWRLGRLLPALRWGTYEGNEQVDTFQGRRVEIHTSRPRRISADGELVSRTPADYEVIPAALTIMVPPDAAQAEGLRNVAQ
jgi:diacylglycerol kinase (ATP)